MQIIKTKTYIKDLQKKIKNKHKKKEQETIEAKEVKEKFAQGNELVLTDVTELDITNKEMVMNVVKREKPDCIINCAAFTAVDKAEVAGEIVEKINADGPGNLAIAAKENDAILVHVSTDYVFGGDLDIEKA